MGLVDKPAEQIDCLDEETYKRCQRSCVRQFGQPPGDGPRARCTYTPEPEPPRPDHIYGTEDDVEDPDCDLEKWKADDWLSNCSDAVNKDFRENMPQNPTPQDFRGWGEGMHNCHKKHKAGRCGTCSWEIQDVDRFACERPALSVQSPRQPRLVH